MEVLLEKTKEYEEFAIEFISETNWKEMKDLEIPLKKLMDYLPVGGESGTLRSWYGGKDKPYVYAKSGTLSNTYCLSGYIITKKGTVLIFSYMNNNYNRPNSNIRREMQEQLSNIYETY